MLAILSTTALAGNISPRLKRAPQFFNGAMNRYMRSLKVATDPGSVGYTFYNGDGSIQAGWPDESEWLDFDTLWLLNSQAWINKVCDNSPEETSELQEAIHAVSEKTGVDPRFILAIVITESRGCVRVPSTAMAVPNPGLMQSYGPHAKGSCHEPTIQNPCPYTEIEQMVIDGTDSNPAGVDLKDLIAKSGATDVSRYYMAARMYNSGPWSIGTNRDLGAPGANRCYAADIANRLVGYTGEGCGGKAQYQKINARSPSSSSSLEWVG